MKNKWLRIIFPAFIAMSALAGCDSSSSNGYFTKYKADMPAEYGVGSYYGSFNFSYTGMKMLKQLHLFSFEKHTKFIEYGSIAGYYTPSTTRESIDSPYKNSMLIENFYTGAQKSSYSGSTREHVWPCANSGGLWDRNNPKTENNDINKNNYLGGGSDLYHVRPCDYNVNSARGNSRYCEVKDNPGTVFKPVTESTGQYAIMCAGLDSSGQFANKTEVPNAYKGDIARIIAYVYVHYSQICPLPEAQKKFDYMCGSLSITSVIGYDDINVAQRKLCEWNEIDPPSPTEKLRNATVQAIQGNRNPFVDYPGLLPRMWGLDGYSK